MKLFTIGFTKSKASQFFERLEKAGVRRVIDTRLNRSSQLSGFAKEDDLRFFLNRVGEIDYTIEKLLAPTQDILEAYRKKDMSWNEYERHYLELISNRKVERHISTMDLDNSCLLCSEATPEHCHRRLAADYLSDFSSGIEIVHL